METNLAADLTKDPISQGLISFLREREDDLNLAESNLYYSFPLYRDEEEGGLVATKILLVSKVHGVFVIGTSDAVDGSTLALEREATDLDQVFSHVFARLLKNRRLRKSKQSLAVPLKAALYAPNILHKPEIEIPDDTTLAVTDHQVELLFEDASWDSPALFTEVVATLEGAKGLIRPTKRDVDDLAPTSKGRLAAQLESEINTFDRGQKHGSIVPFDGPQRIRGLAGSGKTVVLAMKAALTHLREPEAQILYAFWTKSLYQHVRRLITRFYRQFDDRDPDWTKLHVMHGWGGAALPGVYYVASQSAGSTPLNFSEASRFSPSNPFAYACEQLLKRPIKPLYDFVLIDEGQDYPPAFIKLCAQLAKNDRFVIAYDELQNIFQKDAPTAADIFGSTPSGEPSKEFVTDVVLHKCYRNPREILVCAHALGFGIYGKQIVQMLENQAHWEDIGYTVVQGTFNAGSKTVIERPEANSLASISSKQTINELVEAKSFESATDEISWVVDSISADIKDGLKPEDILVITADDRNAKSYLTSVTAKLLPKRVQTHNIHVAFGETDFQEDGSVTLSTVHKAKGNEAYMVYIVGIDALYPNPSIRQRNMLFAAMTRAKGWVRVTGISPAADMFISELEAAKLRFPRLEFTYPSAEQLKVMRRDLEESASKRLRAERLIEQLADDMSQEEIADLLTKLGTNAGKVFKKSTPKRKKGQP